MLEDFLTRMLGCFTIIRPLKKKTLALEYVTRMTNDPEWGSHFHDDSKGSKGSTTKINSEHLIYLVVSTLSPSRGEIKNASNHHLAYKIHKLLVVAWHGFACWMLGTSHRVHISRPPEQT